MTDKELAAGIGYAAGVALSLLFKWFPKLNTWYAGQSSTVKRLIMLGLCIVVGAVVASAACIKLFHWVSCDEQGLVRLVFAIFAVVAGNQNTYLLIPETQAVERAKAAR
jgi:hypothetical protein